MKPKMTFVLPRGVTAMEIYGECHFLKIRRIGLIGFIFACGNSSEYSALVGSSSVHILVVYFETKEIIGAQNASI